MRELHSYLQEKTALRLNAPLQDAEDHKGILDALQLHHRISVVHGEKIQPPIFSRDECIRQHIPFGLSSPRCVRFFP